MGRESGPGDADSDGTADDESTTEPADVDGAESVDQSGERDQESDADDEREGSRPTLDSIPYKLRRSRVNEGRAQVPFFLREEVVEGEDALRAELEETLGEDVYKSDYREAAMVVAQRNPGLVAAVLREWGYDLD
ncbi:hypothetical protein [Salinirubrum litoreum]|uniref:Uncharacterized protein n=1 Tax=Salinirubrum litoreum TaxID=1126234 RepID=A0ABD5RG94_9EURY|nr:hypothetical protein [Salinirubrum litoreum]